MLRGGFHLLVLNLNVIGSMYVCYKIALRWQACSAWFVCCMDAELRPRLQAFAGTAAFVKVDTSGTGGTCAPN